MHSFYPFHLAMHRNCIVRLVPLVGLVLALGSCDSPADPSPGRSDAELTFVRMAPDAPPLETLDTAFWAVRGQEREVQIRYVDAVYGYGKCLRFVVPADAIPEGTAPGDSVRITVHVPDSGLFQFQFGPSGLRFDPDHPARLEIRYTFASPDLNGDGAVDDADTRLADGIAIWRRERSGEPWFRVETHRSTNLVEASADIEGFTIFILASE
ncbi:MAG TPA: hypothetical protein VFI96_06280 [Longimicrobiaceae bacterium]|nr:hypothetical protein [Longimicrobiaceae bacterium]